MRERMWELKQRAEDPGTLELYIYGDVEGDSKKREMPVRV